MANEWNITNEEIMENTADAFAGEGKGVNNENKIVPIVNKGNPAESAVTYTQPGALNTQTTGAVTQPDAQPSASTEQQGSQLSTSTGPAVVQPSTSTEQQGSQLSVPTGPAVIQPSASTGPAVIQPSASTGPTISPASAPTGQTVVPVSAPADQMADQTASYNSCEVPSGSAVQISSAASGTQTASDEEDAGAKAGSGRKRRGKSDACAEDIEDDLDLDEEDRPRKRFFRFRSDNDEESRDKLILSRINDEDLMEYLALEQRRLEFLQQAKEAKEKRMLIAFQLLISLAAIVAITYLLQDNPTILISILYIVGIVAALNVWKNPHDKGRGKR
ncbi:hypothetical protein AALB51_04185 [Lachnospiraceae bacterium 62-26]